MQKRISIIIIAAYILISGLSELFAQVDTLCNGASTTIMGGEYNVMNNVWGSGSGVGQQCISVNMDSSYFKVALSTHHNGSSVAAYPSIFKGCHWGWCTSKNNPMPVQIKDIGHVPMVWKVNTQNDTGTWDAAYDIWFSASSTFNNDYDAELMIWIAYNGGAGPAGSLEDTIKVGGQNWEVYFTVFTSWNYIAYKVTSPVDSVNLDLRDFINDACRRGYLFTPWYLHAVEAGFELFSGGQGLTSKYFSVNVTDTTSSMNFAPSAFILVYPQDGRIMSTSSFPFRWRQSLDADMDHVKYLFHIAGPDRDTTIMLDTTSLNFDGSKFFMPNTSYTWYVESTDNKDTTVSSTRRTISIGDVNAVNNKENIPTKFMLYQNYPNPFNPETRISYSLNKSCQVNLSVFDPLGRNVAVLVDKIENAGNHEIIFSGANLPSGIYYYRLRAGDDVVTNKMSLLK